MIMLHDFKSVFESHYPRLVQRAYVILKDQDAAEDVVQDVFVALWNKREDLKITSSLAAYLNRAVINKSLNYLEKNRKQLPVPELPEIRNYSTEEALAFKELNQQLLQALHQLSPQRQIIFSLSLFEGMTNQEIAEEMGLAKKTIDNQLGTALQQIRKILSNYVHLLIDLSSTLALLVIFFLLSLG